MYVTARARINLIVGGLITGLKVFTKSIPYCWWKPFATSLALYLEMVPSLFLLSLKTHLQPTIFLPGGEGTKDQVLSLKS